MSRRGERARAAKVALALVVVVGGVFIALQPAIARRLPTAGAPHTGCQRGTFADYHNQHQKNVPPAGYRGPVFKLSQDYPDRLPAPEVTAWQSIDVPDLLAGDGAAARSYLTDVLEYAKEGNVEADWVPEKNRIRHWYHAPWLDASADGREFVHGLTHELDSQPGLLGPAQTEVAQTWAVGMYNERGAWSIGQVWCDPQNPDASALNPDDTQPNFFPDGTVVVKLLFTTANDQQAPFLANTFEWKGDIFTVPSNGDPNSPSNGGDPTRSLQTVRLIQVDLAVRDSRMPLGWAFGTYAYDGKTGSTGFDGLEPLGLSWGNSPGITKTMARTTPITSQWLNQALIKSNDLSDLHLGWGGRLSGPLDNPNSSCMSCHQTAGTPAAPLVPEAAPALAGRTLTEAQRLGWFNDLPAGSVFSPDQVDSLDYSLQTTIGLQRFLLANCDARARKEVVSARGPGRRAPAARLPSLCATAQLTSDDDRAWQSLGVGIAGLALGVLLYWLWRRRPPAES